MILREFTSETTEDGKSLIRVSGRISDDADPNKQSQWIEFQLFSELYTSQNAANHRRAALQQAGEILTKLAKQFGQIAFEAQE